MTLHADEALGYDGVLAFADALGVAAARDGRPASRAQLATLDALVRAHHGVTLPPAYRDYLAVYGGRFPFARPMESVRMEIDAVIERYEVLALPASDFVRVPHDRLVVGNEASLAVRG